MLVWWKVKIKVDLVAGAWKSTLDDFVGDGVEADTDTVFPFSLIAKF